MRYVPWWAVLSSACAPVLLVAGWAVAGLFQGAGYNPVRQTISVLASDGAGGYWVMTSAIVALGTCHVVTAGGLRPAALAGRAALAGGGISALALVVFPAPPSGGSLRHGAVVVVGFTLLAVWPVLAAGRGRSVPWGLRPAGTFAVSALNWLCALWFLVALQWHGTAGVAERVLTFLQSFWPLLVVASCVRHPAQRADALVRSRSR